VSLLPFFLFLLIFIIHAFLGEAGKKFFATAQDIVAK